MPSKTAKQARFMAAAAHDKKFAKKANISQSVAREFVEEDEDRDEDRDRDSKSHERKERKRKT